MTNRGDLEDVAFFAANMKIGRWSLVASGIALIAVVVLAIASDLGLGLGDPPPVGDNLQQQAIDSFESHEESYLAYGRWANLALAAAFGGLMVAVPFVPVLRNARHLLIAGSGIAVIGQAIDLSQLIGIDVARFALDNNHMSDFAVGNMYQIGINQTASFVWVAGLFITGIGMLVASRDTSPDRRWRAVTRVFGVVLIATGLAEISSQLQFLQIAQYATAAWALAWIVATLKRTSDARAARQLAVSRD